MIWLFTLISLGGLWQGENKLALRSLILRGLITAGMGTDTGTAVGIATDSGWQFLSNCAYKDTFTGL